MIGWVEIAVSAAGDTRRYVATGLGLGGLLAGNGVSGTEAASSQGPLVVPAEPTVSLVVDLSGARSDGFVTAAGRMYRSAAPKASGSAAWVSLNLTLPGAFRLLGGGLGELDRPVHGLAEVLGARGAELAERVGEAPTWERRFTVVHDFLLRQETLGGAPSPEVLLAWRRLVDSKGTVPVGALADEVGWSSQHLVRTFRRSFGRPPKTLARLLRLRATLRRVRAEGTWRQAAFDAGYYDQAHFTRDLREFTGTTPGRYVRAALPCGCVRQVNSLQDGQVDVP